MVIPEDAPKHLKIKLIKQGLAEHEIQLNPERFKLEREEKIMVQPNRKIHEKKRVMGPSIFKNTWTTIQIPEPVYNRWHNANR